MDRYVQVADASIPLRPAESTERMERAAAFAESALLDANTLYGIDGTYAALLHVCDRLLLVEEEARSLRCRMEELRKKDFELENLADTLKNQLSVCEAELESLKAAAAEAEKPETETDAAEA